MSKRTERALRNEVEQLRERRGDSDLIPGATVEWEGAEPAERPDGMSWDVPDADDEAEIPTLRYDLWGAQRDTLTRLQEADDDIVAFLAGYGTGKSVFGARWIIAQALAHPGSRFLAIGVTFREARETTYPKLFAALSGERTELVTADHNGPETSPIVADYNRQNTGSRSSTTPRSRSGVRTNTPASPAPSSAACGWTSRATTGRRSTISSG